MKNNRPFDITAWLKMSWNIKLYHNFRNFMYYEISTQITTIEYHIIWNIQYGVWYGLPYSIRNIQYVKILSWGFKILLGWFRNKIFSLVIKQFDPKPMAQITKESMQEQRAAEAWFYIQSLIPKEIKLISYDPTCRNKCQMGHLKWLISYGSYGMVRIVRTLTVCRVFLLRIV